MSVDYRRLIHHSFDGSLEVGQLASAKLSQLEVAALDRALGDATKPEDPQSTLNLNRAELRSARKAALEGLTNGLERLLGSGKWPSDKLKRILKAMEGETNSTPFPGIQTTYLIHRLRRA
ncbi:MAG: hypothetical protein IPG45_26855 [Deltaproteobacteria bacterium]|nr:hypothetical protein [Deltaproteobacteria bacterium]